MKRRDTSFVLLSADISHPWQGEQRIGFVLRLQSPPNAACQSGDDMSNLWVKPEVCLVACLWMLENIKLKHHNRSCGTCSDVNKGIIKKKQWVYFNYIRCTLWCCYSTPLKASVCHQMSLLCSTWKECADLNLSHGNGGAICVVWLQKPLLNTRRCWLT